MQSGRPLPGLNMKPSVPISKHRNKVVQNHQQENKPQLVVMLERLMEKQGKFLTLTLMRVAKGKIIKKMIKCQNV